MAHSDATNQVRREDCRRAVRAYLAERPVVALRVEAIVRGLRDLGEFDPDEVRDALHFLSGLSNAQVKAAPNTLGASMAWQITSEGTLAHERDGGV